MCPSPRSMDFMGRLCLAIYYVSSSTCVYDYYTMHALCVCGVDGNIFSCECVDSRLMSTTQVLGVLHSVHGLLQCNNFFFFVALISLSFWPYNGWTHYDLLMDDRAAAILCLRPSYNERAKYKFCADGDCGHITTKQS